MRWIAVWVVLCATAFDAAAGDRDAEPARAYLGPCTVAASRDGATIYVGAADARRVLVVDVKSGRVRASLAMPGEPSGLAVGPEGKRLYVSCAARQSRLVTIDTATEKIAAQTVVGHSAIGPAIGADGRRLYVCNRFDDSVSVVDPVAGRELPRVGVRREPVAAVVTRDGRHVLVANHLPVGRADSFYITPVVSVIDTATLKTEDIELPNGATGLRGLCLSADGRYAMATHILSNYELVPSQVVGGWTNINAVSVIDTATRKLIDTVQLDDVQRGAANPWGVACSPNGRWLCVAHAGTDELSVIDLPGLIEKLSDGPHVAPTAGGVPNSAAFLAGLRRRVKLPGKGARAVSVVDGRAYVAEYFSDDIVVVELDRAKVVRVIPLGPKPRWTTQRRGEILFNDATICYQQWQSCASCHPDGRVDGLNWDLTNDGVGNPKNTRSMLLAHRTPPAMSLGVRESAEAAVRSGLEHILFADQPEEDAAAIDRYLESLQSVGGARLVGGELSESARRGKRIFEDPGIGCARCHPAPLYTDRRAHDVGTLGANEPRNAVDTPTLVEAWRTAPYLHDGRCATLPDVFFKERHGLRGGRREKLSRRQVADLVEFVLSL